MNRLNDAQKELRYRYTESTAPNDTVRDARLALLDRILQDNEQFPLVGEELERILKAAEADVYQGHVRYLTFNLNNLPRGPM